MTANVIELTSDLPSERQVGTVASWTLPSGAGVVTIVGWFLGVSTSKSSVHRHPSNREPGAHEKCRACRWFEPRIFRESAGQRRYLVHRTGRTIVPDEVTFTSHEWALSPHEVIEVLTIRKRDPRTGNRAIYLAQPAARVLAQAAAFDDDINQAYVDRAVA